MQGHDVDELLRQAESFHDACQFSEAEKLYRFILQGTHIPDKVYFLYGTLELQRGNFAEAVALLGVACEKKPDSLRSLNHLGIALHSLGKNDEALEVCSLALEISRDDISTLSLLGGILAGQGKYEAAIPIFEKAVRISSDNSEVKYNYALCLQQSGAPDAAFVQYNEILSVNPLHVQSLINSAFIEKERGNLIQAELLLQKACEAEPNNPDALYNYASVLVALKKYFAAEKLLELIVKASAGFCEAWNLLGRVQFETFRFEEAVQCFKQCLQLQPEFVQAYLNAGVASFEAGLFDQSVGYLRKGLELEPENAALHFALSETLLAMGEFTEGLQEYEYRLFHEIYKDKKYAIPRWRGEQLAGKRLYIFEEQGAGDTFHFIRFCSYLKSSGAYIIFACRSSLQGLIECSGLADEVVPDSDADIPDTCDFYIPLVSIPYVLGGFQKGLQMQGAYLQVPDSARLKWKGKLASYKGKKIGLVWSGNTAIGVNTKRHCMLRELLPIMRLPGYEFFSLQVGGAASELNELPAGIVVHDLGARISDFEDTAAIIEQLDLVITVDTSVAHLAGALGKQTYVLLSKIPDWRWHEDGDKSSWYPSTVLFRQKQTGDWAPVINQIIRRLTMNSVSGFTPENPLLLVLPSGENFGWGVCSKYLKKHLAERTSIKIYQKELGQEEIKNLAAFKAIADIHMKPAENLLTRASIGYTFFEFELPPEALENAREYDIILGGSTWNKQKLDEAGITNNGVLIQGIDPELFYPLPAKIDEKLFVIFSGGKFELRKGQDLVLAAFARLQDKYPDMILMNAWYNFWPQTMLPMHNSRHIKFDLHGDTWGDVMSYIYKLNGIKQDRVITLPIVDNTRLREVYARSDIGLFPNRCEGGTNLVLMEYMACGKPVIASYNSGHMDVLTDKTSYMLKDMKNFEEFDGDKRLIDWREANIDEIISMIEFAYHHRGEIRSTGERAGEYMKQFTWEKSAEHLLSVANRFAL
ncbi:MAG: tetratricopeptide repeat protein [Ignavibacteria bacterium]|nr:tetratricopeptide repeat protein [Ignavibacteria bacterium]